MLNLDFDEIINKSINIFKIATSSDPDCLKRYRTIISLLDKMRNEVNAKIYPHNYDVLPLFNYIERHLDSDDMYKSIKELDEWYAENYRTKSKEVICREQIKEYLLSTVGFSEKRVDIAISKLARHKKIYLEFADYVTTGCFPKNGISIAGYTAEELYNKYCLSPFGAYNYLIYLHEMPEKALLDLKTRLPTKDLFKTSIINKNKL